jgi:hypothetical protein
MKLAVCDALFIRHLSTGTDIRHADGLPVPVMHIYVTTYYPTLRSILSIPGGFRHDQQETISTSTVLSLENGTTQFPRFPTYR